MNTPEKTTRQTPYHLLDDQKREEKQHHLGKLTARERIALLTDTGSFLEYGKQVTDYLSQQLPGDGIITGLATINGRNVAIYAQDFTIQGGSVGKHHAEKICKIMDIAGEIGCPIIGLIDSGGARIQEGIHALAGYGNIFKRNVTYSGIVPQFSLILGPCAGGAVYSPALTDFVFGVEGISQLFITGPQVIAQVTGQIVDKETLGGTTVHSTQSGVMHMTSSDEEECFAQLKTLLSYLPSNYLEAPPISSFSEPLAPLTHKLIPKETSKNYDVRLLIAHLFDDESFCEVSKQFAPHMVIGFARLAGKSVGIVANQPLHKAGTIDSDASCKAARFIMFCDAFDIPIISLVDVPGYLPGVEQEANGIIRHGAKLLSAYAQATIPLLTIITRKAFGGAYIVMGSKHLGADFVAAWPEAQIAVMGAEAATSIIYRKELDTAKDTCAKQAELSRAYHEQYLNPHTAATHGYIDAIITPEETRAKLIATLSFITTKVVHARQKKSPNIPL